jgi:alkanesulfonate monooxygenase SsuD/methylene tetrahydromethanopterin reductase-like flavin-dependent oxidoreductase (luciferase family)
VAVANLEWPGFKERFARLRESVDLMRALWLARRAGDLRRGVLPDNQLHGVRPSRRRHPEPYLEVGFNHLVFYGPSHDQSRFLTKFSEQVLWRLRAT